MIGLCYAASNTRRSHTRASKLNGFHGAMLDDAFRASAILHDREMGVQGTVSEPNRVRPEDAVQTALPELGSGGKLTTLRGTQRNTTYKIPIVLCPSEIQRVHLQPNND